MSMLMVDVIRRDAIDINLLWIFTRSVVLVVSANIDMVFVVTFVVDCYEFVRKDELEEN